MYEEDIDDGELGAKIANLDKRIRQAEIGSAPTWLMRRERANLCVELAAAALVDDAPLPGADAEYQAAKQVQAALKANDLDLMAATVGLLPRGVAGWGRLTIWYGAVGGLLFLAAQLCRWVVS
jgi:hypothetical protein